MEESNNNNDVAESQDPTLLDSSIPLSRIPDQETSKPNLSRADVLSLIHRKDEIEAEVNALQDLLTSQGNVGMHGPLLDNDGYPRSDIDVYSVRHARHKIICLNNDHIELMGKIEEGLNNLHAQTRTEFMELESPLTSPESSSAETSDVFHPFAKIQFVMPDSPAAAAGLLGGDLISVFGSATVMNFRSLTDLATIVGNSENRSIIVRIVRNGSAKQINLIPKKWSGKGLLGCSFEEIRKIRL